MLFTTAQIEYYRTRGYVSGPRVLSAGQVEVLKERIDDILRGAAMPCTSCPATPGAWATTGTSAWAMSKPWV